MTAIVSTTLFLILSLIWLFQFSRLRWTQMRSRRQWQLKLLGCAHIFFLLLLAYAAWPLLPIGQAQRGQTVDAFLHSLHDGDVETVLNMIVSTPQEELTPIQNALADSQNYPVSWEMAEPNGNNVSLGEISFSESRMADATIHLEWEWEQARWGISGFLLEGERSENELRFVLPSTFLPYSWFRSGLFFLSILLVLFTVWQIWRLRRAWTVLQDEASPLSDQTANF